MDGAKELSAEAIPFMGRREQTAAMSWRKEFGVSWFNFFELLFSSSVLQFPFCLPENSAPSELKSIHQAVFLLSMRLNEEVPSRQIIQPLWEQKCCLMVRLGLSGKPHFLLVRRLAEKGLEIRKSKLGFQDGTFFSQPGGHGLRLFLPASLVTSWGSQQGRLWTVITWSWGTWQLVISMNACQMCRSQLCDRGCPTSSGVGNQSLCSARLQFRMVAEQMVVKQGQTV